MDATGAGLPVAAVRTHRRLDLSVLARLVGSILTLAAVIGLSTVGFSTASRAETVPAVMETSVPQLKLSIYPYPVYASMAAIQAAYPPGETNVWVYQLSNYGGYDKAFYTDVHPLPGCVNCYTEPLGYTWLGQFVQISPYCLYDDGNIVSPVGYTSVGTLQFHPSRERCRLRNAHTGYADCRGVFPEQTHGSQQPGHWSTDSAGHHRRCSEC